MDLFVYGTLMETDLLHRLTGKRFRAEPARLPGFRRFQSPGCYPYIVVSAEQHVDGLLLRDIDDDTLQTLDRYEAEGDLYFRRTVVAVIDGVHLPCETYVGNASALDRLAVR
jgi:gamma-glutamylcyclotransferase (GGCT)/AIG2-like uncharacterized protein YtfP